MPRKRKNAHPGFWPVILGGPSRRAKPARKRSTLSSAIRSLGGTRIVKVGDHYEVPSLDRGSWFDSRADAQRFIKAVRSNPAGYLYYVAHQGSIISGAFDTKTQAKAEIRQMKERMKRSGGAWGRYTVVKKKTNPKRKRNIEIGLPKNKWINAKIRVTSGGKAQALVSESVLGHAKAGGSVSLNPRKRRAKRRKR